MERYFSEMLDGQQMNPIVIVPVLFAFMGAILVFMFGFKKPVEPHFKKIVYDLSKKTKRNVKSQKTPQNEATLLSCNKTSEKKITFNLSDNSQSGSIKKEKKIDKKNSVQYKKVGTNKLDISLNKKFVVKDKEPNIPDDGEWMIVTGRADRKKKIDELKASTLNSVKKFQTSLKGNKNDIQKEKSQNKQKEQVEKSTKKSVNNQKLNPSKNRKNKIQKLLQSEESDSFQVPTKINEENGTSSINSQMSMHSLTSNETLKEASNVVFDELQDEWIEQNASKKSKKKALKE